MIVIMFRKFAKWQIKGISMCYARNYREYKPSLLERYSTRAALMLCVVFVVSLLIATVSP